MKLLTRSSLYVLEKSTALLGPKTKTLTLALALTPTPTPSPDPNPNQALLG